MNKYEGYIFGKVNSLNVSDEDVLKWARQDFEAGIMNSDEWDDLLREYRKVYLQKCYPNDNPMLYCAQMELEDGIMTPDEYTNLYNTLLRANHYCGDKKDMIKYRDTDVIATEEAYKKFKDDKEKHSIADDLNVCKLPDHYIIRGNLSTDIKTLLDACFDPTVSLDEFRNMITAHNALLEYYRDTSEKVYLQKCYLNDNPIATPEKSDEQIISEEMEEEHKKETEALKDTIRMLEFILNEYETAMGTTISERCRKNLDD